MPEKKRIVIENGTARIETVFVDRIVSLFDALSALPKSQAVALPRLPKNCRFFYSENRRVTLLIELEPGPRFIRTTEMRNGLHLSMPWQYMYFTFSEVANAAYPNVKWKPDDYRIFWSQHKLQTMDEPVIPARLPNVYDTDFGRICFGDTAPTNALELDVRVDTIVNDFFTPVSIFNNHLGWHIPAPYDSFRAWAIATRADPLIALKWPWWDDKKKLEEYKMARMTQYLRFLSFYNSKEGILTEATPAIHEFDAPEPENHDVDEIDGEFEVWEDFEEELVPVE